MYHFLCRINKAMISILAITICASMLGAVSVYALSREVEIDNHTTQTDGSQSISGITIDGVTAPTPDGKLDDTASVTATGNGTWDIPVIWVDDALEISTQFTEGKTYLPALAYFVPAGYVVQGNTYLISLSDDLTALFGTHDIISVYNEATGITYIIPANLMNIFASQENSTTNENKSRTDENESRADKNESMIIPAVRGTPVSEGFQNLVNGVDRSKDKAAVVAAKDLKVTNVKAKARKGRKALITWKKNKKAAGYQICCSMNKNFKKSVKKITVKKASHSKAWLRGLKADKTYYVKVRTMKKVTSKVTGKTKTVYGKWSVTRKFKARK